MSPHPYRAACIAAAVLLGACALTPRLAPPKLSVAGVQLAGGDLWEQRFKVRMHVENPNPHALPVKDLEYTLEVAGQPFAEGTATAPFIVPARGEAEFDMQVTTHFAGPLITLLARGPEGHGQSVDYHLRGKVSLSMGLMRSIPFDERGSFRLQ